MFKTHGQSQSSHELFSARATQRHISLMAGRSGAPFQPASIYLLMKSKPLSLRNDEISEMQRDNDRGFVLKMKPPRCAVIISTEGRGGGEESKDRSKRQREMF